MRLMSMSLLGSWKSTLTVNCIVYHRNHLSRYHLHLRPVMEETQIEVVVKSVAGVDVVLNYYRRDQVNLTVKLSMNLGSYSGFEQVWGRTVRSR